MYEPKLPPDVRDPELQRVIDWCKDELAAISLDGAALNALELRTINAPPTKPREGMIVEADGVNWNPGSGPGQYVFRGGVWVRQLKVGDTFTLAANITDEGALAYLNEVALADMADLQTKRLIGRNTASTGIPEALSIETVLDWLGTTRGQLLKRGSSVWEVLGIGAPGTALVSDGTDPLWDSAKGFDYLAKNVSASTGAATLTIDNTIITKAYSRLEMIIQSVSHDNASSRALLLELSGDNGSTFSSTTPISAAVANTLAFGGSLIIDDAAVASASRVLSGFTQTAVLASQQIYPIQGTLSVTTGAVNCMRFSWNGAGNFDSFVYTLLGWK